MDMDKGSRTLGWLGLITGGALSVGANVRSIHLPDMPDVDLGSYVVAVAPVALAMLGIEQVARWRHLPDALRYGVVGLASLIAVAASWTHIVSVMKHYGQPDTIAYSFPLAVDGIMLLSSLSLFVSFPDRTPDTEPVRYAVAVSETDSVWTDNGTDMSAPDTDMSAPDTDMSAPDTDMSAPDTDMSAPDTDTVPDTDMSAPDTDTVPDFVPDAWTDKSWKVDALRLIGEGYRDAEVAQRIMQYAPDTWSTLEAGRKAVSRLRSAP